MQRCFDTCNFDKVRFLKEMYKNLLEAILKTDIFDKLLRNKFNQGDVRPIYWELQNIMKEIEEDTNE